MIERDYFYMSLYMVFRKFLLILPLNLISCDVFPANMFFMMIYSSTTGGIRTSPHLCNQRCLGCQVCLLRNSTLLVKVHF